MSPDFSPYFSYSGPISASQIYQTFFYFGAFVLTYLYLEHEKQQQKQQNLDVSVADSISFFRSYFPPQISFPQLIFVKFAPAFTMYFVLFIVIHFEIAYSFISSLLDTSSRIKTQWKNEICGHIICFLTRLILCSKEYLLNKYSCWLFLVEISCWILLKNTGQEIPGEEKVLELQRERSGDKWLRK